MYLGCYRIHTCETDTGVLTVERIQRESQKIRVPRHGGGDLEVTEPSHQYRAVTHWPPMQSVSTNMKQKKKYKPRRAQDELEKNESSLSKEEAHCREKADR